VSKSDEGSYSCTARNEAGVEEGRLQLLVEETSGGSEHGPRPGGSEHGSSRPVEPARERDEVYYFPVGSRAELRCAQSKLQKINSIWSTF